MGHIGHAKFLVERSTLYCLVIIAAIAILLIPGCNEESPPPRAIFKCSETAPPFFIESKIDDDDSDGYPYDEDFPDIDDEDDDIADHCWITDEAGNYHLFFHTEERGKGSHIDHYVTTDFINPKLSGFHLLSTFYQC